MYVDGLNLRRIARTLQVNHQSVINWVNAHIAGLPDAPPWRLTGQKWLSWMSCSLSWVKKATSLRHNGCGPGYTVYC